MPIKKKNSFRNPLMVKYFLVIELLVILILLTNFTLLLILTSAWIKNQIFYTI